MQLLEEIKHFSGWRQQRVAKIVHCGPPGYTLSTRRHLQVNARGTWSEWQILGHFSQVLEETEHFVVGVKRKLRRLSSVGSLRGSDARPYGGIGREE